MPGLRVVHFRYSHIAHENSHLESNISQTDATFYIQRFVNAFFAWLHEHNACPKLKGVILGMYCDPEHILYDEDGQALRRHCYVKGRQTDVFGREIVVGVPVPAYMIRELEPDCDLLNFDPKGKWSGSLPGRYHRL